VDADGDADLVVTNPYEDKVGVLLNRRTQRGDLNCDGAIDLRDINRFVLYLSDLAAWQSAYPDCDPRSGDINWDGVYPSLGDINAFVALLLGRD
jgi:hypothetical protein